MKIVLSIQQLLRELLLAGKDVAFVLIVTISSGFAQLSAAASCGLASFENHLSMARIR